MARRSFFSRLADTLRGLAGTGPPPTPPEPEAVAPEPPPETEYYVNRPPEIEYFVNPQHECEIRYIPTHQETRIPRGYIGKSGTAVRGRTYSQTVVGRWVVGDETNPPDAICFGELLTSSGKRDWVNLIIGGIYFQEYPGQENEYITYLSYLYRYGSIVNALDAAGVDGSATNVMNELVAPFGEWWEEVFEVTIVDR